MDFLYFYIHQDTMTHLMACYFLGGEYSEFIYHYLSGIINVYIYLVFKELHHIEFQATRLFNQSNSFKWYQVSECPPRFQSYHNTLTKYIHGYYGQ